MYKHNKTMAVITGIASIALMILVFCFSAQNDTLSSEMSGNFFKFVCSILHFFIRSADKQAALDAFLQQYIRKLAHFTEFALLGFFLTLFYAAWQKKLIKLPLLPFPLGVIYACSDEWHQTFISGRSGEFRDILIDTAGVATGILTAILILWLFTLVQQKRQRKDINHSNSKAPV